MKSLKYILTVLALVLCSISFSQRKLEITSSKQTFSQTETGSTTVFTFIGNTDEAAGFQRRADALKDRLTLTMTKNEDGTYTCTLNVLQQPHEEYVVKMLMTLGITKITIDGTEKPIEDLTEALKTMKG